MHRLPRTLLPIAAFAMLMGACADDDEVDDAASVTEPDGVQREVRPAPPLDVETSTATLAGTTVSVERSPGETYVGAVTEDLFIAVAFPEQSGDAAAQAATVYLCDSAEISEWLRGDVGTEPTALDGERLVVELSRDGGTVEGRVTFDDGSVHPFTAAQATGDAGLYTVEFDDSALLDGLDTDAAAAEAAVSEDQPTDHRIAGACRWGTGNCGWIVL